MPPRTAVSKKGGKRRYVREVDGVPTEHVNVTGATSQWGNGPWKIPYGAKMVAECALESLESGKLDALYDADKEAALKYLKGAPYRDRDTAAAKGTKVHEAWEEYLKGDEPEIHDPDVAAMFENLRILSERYECIWERSEQTVFNSTDGWAGTMDGIVLLKFPGDEKHTRCIVDLKSSRSVQGKHEYVMQLNGLANGEVIVHDDGSEEPMPKVDGAVIFHVRPDKAEVIPVALSPESYRDFMVCVAMVYAEQGADGRVTYLPPLGDPNDDTKLLTERKSEES
jgi:hypothetical protein